MQMLASSASHGETKQMIWSSAGVASLPFQYGGFMNKANGQS